MGVRGAFGRLRTMINGARAMAGGALERAEGRLMQEAKAALQETVAESFLYQRTPDGKPWGPRITVYGDYRDTNPLLFDLLSFMFYEVTDGTVIAKNRKYYAFFHMTPFKRRVARVFLPSSTAPEKLTDRIKLAALRAIGGAVGHSGAASVRGSSTTGGAGMPGMPQSLPPVGAVGGGGPGGAAETEGEEDTRRGR